MKKVQVIATHHQPHLDEIVAIWLLRMFGEVLFPGVSGARLEYWSADQIKESVEKLEEEGVLLVGIGGGRFDEHPTVDQDRKTGECAATLVAEALGLMEAPDLKKILGFVVQVDLKGSSSPFDLSAVTKVMYTAYPEDPDLVVEWATRAIVAKYEEQKRFFSSTKEEFERRARHEITPGPKLAPVKLVVIQSDDGQVNQYARSAYGGCCDVIVQQTSTGNVQIYSRKQSGIMLRDAIRMIRIEEMRCKGIDPECSWDELGAEGTIRGAEEWFYQESGQMLLNGSKTAQGVPPTNLSLEEIRAIIKAAINPRAFEPDRTLDCTGGYCSATRRNPCPWYAYGLSRCRKIRYDMIQSSGSR